MADISTEDTDAKVNELLALIENEKRQPKPNKRQMRKWFNEIAKLKDDYRETYTGQDNYFMTHTSMRTWEYYD